MRPSRIPPPVAGRRLARSTRRRRERLTELERDVDPAVRDERRQALRALLARPLLAGNDPARVLVRRQQEWLGLWFSHHAGWELSIDAEACRLVKRPAHTRDGTRPCYDPSSKNTPLGRRAYVFLCLVLGILLREGRQLTLKNIAERLGGIGRADSVFTDHGVPLDLDRREVRRDLVRALRVLLDWRVLSRVDGSEDAYIVTEATDVLYNVNRAILSRLLAARQPPSLAGAEDIETRLEMMWRGSAAADQSEDWRIREIRFGIFRRLLDDPVLYYRHLDDDERAYLERQRTFILREIEQATGLVAEVRAEGIAMVDLTGDLTDYGLPRAGTGGHLTLLLATSLAERLRSGDPAPVPESELQAETRRHIEEHPGWRKDVRNPGSEVVLVREVIVRLCALGLARRVDAPDPALEPLPAIARFGLREPAPSSAAAGELELFG